MDQRIVTKIAFFMLCAAGTCWASVCDESPGTSCRESTKADPVDAVLEKLNKRTLEIESYQGQIEYKYTQPSIESEALRKGVLYYWKSGTELVLRINFNALKQEDEKEQKYIEQYIVLNGARLTHRDYRFTGVWLVQIDYEIEAVQYYQLPEPNDPNEPFDVFRLASRNLPMLGFTEIDDLKKEFEIELIEQKKTKPEDFIQVHLKVKPNSIYKDDYVSIDFWIDRKLGLPVKVVAVKAEPEPPFGDIYEIKFLNSKVNKGIDKKVFEFKIPRGFGEPDIIPLKKKGKQG